MLELKNHRFKFMIRDTRYSTTCILFVYLEIKRIEIPEKKEEPQKKGEKVFQDVTSQKFSKVSCDIRIPAEDHPSVGSNFLEIFTYSSTVSFTFHCKTSFNQVC